MLVTYSPLLYFPTLLFIQRNLPAPELASMERNTCNLCLRHFPNGRSLGGHMRSHVVPAAPSHLPGDSSGSASSKEAEEAGLSYGLRTNPRKSFRLVDPEFSSSFSEPGGSCVVVHDRESDTESPRARAQSSRSKRTRRATVSPPEAEPVSSVSDATPEEDVALCLMMLSRDSWAAAAEDRHSDEEDVEAERRPAARSRAPSRKGRTRYQCDACKKVFRSYQALGGHRATQKKTGCCASVNEPQIYGEADSADVNAGAKVHECPFCFRVFSSGQALGGHKRSHLVSSSFQITSSSPVLDPPSLRSQPSISPVMQHLQIDLNLPAQADDDVELSAVSDVDFIATHSTRQ